MIPLCVVGGCTVVVTRLQTGIGDYGQSWIARFGRFNIGPHPCLGLGAQTGGHRDNGAIENNTPLMGNQLQRRAKQLLLIAVVCDAKMLLNHLSGIQVFVVPPVRSIIRRRPRFVLRSGTVHEV